MGDTKADTAAGAGVAGNGESGGRIRLLVLAGEAQLRQLVEQLLAAGVSAHEIGAGCQAPSPARPDGDGEPAAPCGRRRYVRRLPVRQSEGVLRYVKVEQIDWIEAANQYVRLHAGERRHLVRESMARLESWLDPRQFVRVHRSAIVNLDRVDGIQIDSSSSRCVVLAGGTRLEVSSRHWQSLQAALLGLR
jgi:DNA-binding LytR/AlgR family response regulator